MSKTNDLDVFILRHKPSLNKILKRKSGGWRKTALGCTHVWIIRKFLEEFSFRFKRVDSLNCFLNLTKGSNQEKLYTSPYYFCFQRSYFLLTSGGQ